jgi:predicted ATPase
VKVVDMAHFDRVTIRGLFGRDKDEVIEFEGPDNYRILYGLNGCGKSTVLRLIDAALNWNERVLFQTEFKSIEFEIETEKHHHLAVDNLDPLDHLPECELTDDEYSKLIEYVIIGEAPTFTNGLADCSEVEFSSMYKRTFTIERDIKGEMPSLITATSISSKYGYPFNSEEENKEYSRTLFELLPKYAAAFATSFGALKDCGSFFIEDVDVFNSHMLAFLDTEAPAGVELNPKLVWQQYLDKYIVEREYKKTLHPYSSDDYSRSELHRQALKLVDFFNIDIFDNDGDGLECTVKRKSDDKEIPFPRFASQYMPPPGGFEWARPDTLSRYLQIPCINHEGNKSYPKGSLESRRHLLSYPEKSDEVLFNNWIGDDGVEKEYDPLYDLKPGYQYPSGLIYIRPDRLNSLFRDGLYNDETEEMVVVDDLLSSLDDSKGVIRLMALINGQLSAMLDKMGEVLILIQEEINNDKCTGIVFETETSDLEFDSSGLSSRLDELSMALKELAYEWEFESDNFHEFMGFWDGLDIDADIDYKHITKDLCKENNLHWVESHNYYEGGVYNWENNPWEHLDAILNEIDKFTLIGHLSKIIEKRMGGKKFVVDSGGELFISDNGRRIGVEQLSSGERHLLLMFLYLILEVEANTLILIDEPEISLHISWQRKFIDDLLDTFGRRDIIDGGNSDGVLPFRAIIATHSPSIIANHLNNSIELGIGVDSLEDGEW